MTAYYADGFSIATGLVDTKLDIISVDPIRNEKGDVVGEAHTPQCRVTMSLPLAKELVTQLSMALSQYEKTYGEILDLKKLREKSQDNG